MKAFNLTKWIKPGLGALATIGLLFAGSVQAAGLLKPSNASLPDLEIREHHVDVMISDGYVTTEVKQIFHNPNAQDLEAIYSFPVPAKAAVGEFSYWIDGQPVHGEVVEKQRARQIYETEKQAGREAALVEKDEYKTFDISVYPVRANSDVRIRLVYLQAADIDHGVGRYVYPLEEGGVDEQKLSFWSRNEVVKEKFSFNLKIRSAHPVDSVRLPHHSQASIQSIDAQQWQVGLANASEDEEGQSHRSQQTHAASLDQDILLYWRLTEGLHGTLDLLSYKKAPDQRGTFMLTLTPGDDLASIQGGRDWIFVLDQSGSMSGKYSTLVNGVQQALGKLRSEDRFRVILFNDQAKDISGGYQAVSPANVRQALDRLSNSRPSGGTDLYSGLDFAMDKLDSDRPSAVVLVTDGVANVGNSEKKHFIKLLNKHDVRLFTFIMGNSANRPLLEEMTEVSNGFALSVSNADDIVGKIMQATSKLTHQALRNIKLDIEGVNVNDVTPEKIGSLYRGEQLILFGHYNNGGPAQITLRGDINGQQKIYQTEVTFPDQADAHPQLERLWAYAFIQHLKGQMDYYGADKDIEQAITDTAMAYGLVTDYTSMLVVREEVFQQLQIARGNKQRIEHETSARQANANQAVQSHRADQAQPMFDKPRPTLSGGGGSGSFDPWMLLLLTLLAVLSLARVRATD